MSKENADIGGLKPHVRKVAEQFKQLFPDFDIVSGYRSPEYNRNVKGAGDSRHIHAAAFDFNPQKGVSDERKADAVNWLRSQGAMGFGTYDKTGRSFHADWRTSGPAMWGPNRSRTSLDRTPDWFQRISADHFAGRPAPTQLATVPPGSIPNVPARAAQAAPSGGYDSRREIYNKLTSLGVPPQTAAGAVGSLMGESGTRLNPSAINRNDNPRSRIHPDSIGMGQWNDTRAVALKRTAGEMGVSWEDPRAQVAHLGNELQGSHRHVLDALRKAPDSVENGARLWTTKYEVAGVPHMQRRIEHGQSFAAELARNPASAPVQVASNDPSFAPTLPQRAQTAEPQRAMGAFAGFSPTQGNQPIVPRLISMLSTPSPAQAAPLAASPTSIPGAIPFANPVPAPQAAPQAAPAVFTPPTPAPAPVAAPTPPQASPDLPQRAQGVLQQRPGITDFLPPSFAQVAGITRDDPTPLGQQNGMVQVGSENAVRRPTTGSDPFFGHAATAPMSIAPQPGQTHVSTDANPDPAPAENPLVVRGIRPRSQDALPQPQPQMVPLPPQRPGNDQLFPQMPQMPERAQGGLPMQGSTPTIWGANWHGPDSGLINRMQVPAGTPYPDVWTGPSPYPMGGGGFLGGLLGF